MKHTTIVLLTALVLFAMPAVALAQDGDAVNPSGVDWTDLWSVFEYLAAGGGAMLVAAAFSWLAENVSAWHKLSSNLKFVIGLVASGALSLLSQIALEWELIQAGTFNPTIDSVYHFFAIGAAAWIASQLAYMKAKSAGYATNAQSEK